MVGHGIIMGKKLTLISLILKTNPLCIFYTIDIVLKKQKQYSTYWNQFKNIKEFTLPEFKFQAHWI